MIKNSLSFNILMMIILFVLKFDCYLIYYKLEYETTCESEVLYNVNLLNTTPKRPSRYELIEYDDWLQSCRLGHETYSIDMKNIEKYSTLSNFTKFSIAVDNAFCSTMGKNILNKNGSIVDAAITASLCNGLMNAQSGGIGGGSFILLYLNGTSYAIDARESAPANSFKTMFSNNKSSLLGGLSTAIPGEIAGYWEAYKIGGRLPWKLLFEPIIEMCFNGFKMSKQLSRAVDMKEKEIRSNGPLSSIFINSKTNETFKENDSIKMVKLGQTLKIISEQNVTAFYNGSLTKIIVNEINNMGGNVTLNDFLNYRALLKSPIVTKLDDQFTIHSHPLPSSGIIVSFILKLMQGFNLNENTLRSVDEQTRFYHRLIESFKYGFAKRTFMGDENFVNNMNEFYYNLTNNTQYIDEIRLKILNSNYTHPSHCYDSDKNEVKSDHGTTHLSLIAGNDAVALTSTVNT
jgi:gamma-glutamyltranspeptidase / glutathione hydrolase / leukotriene-C4 hydrolase